MSSLGLITLAVLLAFGCLAAMVPGTQATTSVITTPPGRLEDAAWIGSEWVFRPVNASQIPLWNLVEVNFTAASPALSGATADGYGAGAATSGLHSDTGANVVLSIRWSAGSEDVVEDVLQLNIGGSPTTAFVHSRVYAPNVFQGVSYVVNGTKVVTASSPDATSLQVNVTSIPMRVSQGLVASQHAVELHAFSFSSDGKNMTWRLTTPTRSTPYVYDFLPRDSMALSTPHPTRSTPAFGPGPRPINVSYVPLPSPFPSPEPWEFNKLSTRPLDASSPANAADGPWVYNLDDDWKLSSRADEKSMLLSLQGLANRLGPKVYFIYPQDWAFSFTPAVYDFYANHRNLSFTNLTSSNEVVQTVVPALKPSGVFKGYVVFDPEVRVSLVVAFTAAGIESGLVVSERLIPLVESVGLTTCLLDLRGKWNSSTTRVEAYTWALQEYGDRIAKNLTMWLGGAAGDIIRPAVADLGVSEGAFFADLSTRTTDVDDYALASKIFANQDPYTMVIGWHRYDLDLERTFVTLTSSHALRVEGLNTNPNLSFGRKVPVSPGFQFKNHKNVVPGKTYMPQNKVYITCVQTDGLGLGAWNKKGRGSIPYAWEVTMNYEWLAPARLEYFYSTATPNDFFVGAISCAGYCYPKPVPQDKLAGLLEITRQISDKLDISGAFETMDYSQGATVTGTTDLPQWVVDTYFEAMPDALGLINGYSPSYTFDESKTGRPFLSFDYYLDPARTIDEAVEDLRQLARLNPVRPYFITAHIREWGDVERTKEIIDGLGSDFELVPLDIFLAYAGQKPTFAHHVEPWPSSSSDEAQL